MNQMEIFDFINSTCEKIIAEIPKVYENMNTSTLEDYKRPEFLRLLNEVKFSNENLYVHDMEQPNYNNLDRDMFKLIQDGYKFLNYCDLIGFRKLGQLDICISDTKAKYYERHQEKFDREEKAYELFEEVLIELEYMREHLYNGREFDLIDRIKDYLGEWEEIICYR